MSARGHSLAILALAAALVGCSENHVDDPCAEAPDAAGALPVDIEGASWGFTFCARYEGGGTRCWGDNSHGQIGPIQEYSYVVPLPTIVDGVGCIVDIAPAGTVTCAGQATGDVRCWGSDLSGEMGNGHRISDSGVPDGVVDLHDAVSVHGFGLSMSALRASGGVVAWGLIDSVDSTFPVPVPEAGTDVRSYSFFFSGGCSVQSDTAMTCWGGNLLDSTAPRQEPHVVVASGATEVLMAQAHACVISDTAALACWGSNATGELGDGTLTDRSAPTPIKAIDNVKQVVLGAHHTCARDGGGIVWCWGHNFSGAVGPSAMTTQTTPIQVPLPMPAVDIAAAALTTCALDQAGVIWCWGRNAEGELGTGELIPESFEPHRVLW